MKRMKKHTISKKLVSVILAVAILASCLVAGFTSVAAGDWDGTAATAFAGGSGTSADPYLISTPGQLMLAASSTGLNGDGGQNYYKMTNNIYLNAVGTEGWETASPNEWLSVSLDSATADTAFAGVFDGDGYMVYGLYVSESYAAPADTSADRSVAAGLFPTVGAGAVIKNVGIDAAYLSLTNDHATASLAYAGQVGLVGYAYNSSTAAITFDRCFIGEKVTMKAVFAGLVGDLKTNTLASVVMTNCYAVPVTVETFNEPDKVYIYNNRFMLASGRDNSAAYKLDYCYSVGNLTFTGGGSTDTKYNYCTSWTGTSLGTVVSKANMKGASAFDNMSGLNTRNAYTLTDSYPVLTVFNKIPANVWDGTTATPTALDDNGNLIIGTAEELAYVIKNGGGASYVLSNDIYLNDITAIDWSTGEVSYGYTAREWYSTDTAAAFSGSIDGQGHTVYGIYYTVDTVSSSYGANAVALIPKVANAAVTVKNLGVDYSYIKYTNNAAGLIGHGSNTAVRTIDSCYVGENTTIIGEVAGGIFGGGDASLNISNCYSLATLGAATKNGGILGGTWRYSYGGVSTQQTVVNCYSTTALYGNSGASTEASVKANVGTDCKGQGAIKNFSLGEPFCATDDSYPTLRVFAGLTNVKDWNGLGISTFEGSGTEEDPYIVENAGQLAYISYSGASGHYKMVNDIYINDVSADNWQENDSLINWIWEETYGSTAYYATSKQFKGTFDGNGYVVHGIWYSPDIKTQVAGLFLSADGATIKNVGIKNSYMYAGYTKDWAIEMGYATSSNAANRAIGVIGAIVSWTHTGASTTVSGCFSDDSVYLHNYSDGNLCATGGIVGYIYSNSSAVTAISDCWSAADMYSSYSNKLNGILGSAWSGYYTATHNYTLSHKPWMMDSTNTLSKVTDAYTENYTNTGSAHASYTVLSTEQMKGASALTNMAGFSDEIWYAVNDNGMAPLHRVYGTAIGDVDENGIGKGIGDILALRETLIGAKEYKNTDYNRSGTSDICDLVEMNINYRPIITFSANGGAFANGKSLLSKEIAVGGAINVALPTLSGYGCVGWSLTPDGQAIESDVVTAEMDGAILYAVWEKVLVMDASFTDGMILQRNKPICVWGTGTGSGEITIGNQTKSVSSETGTWEVYFEPMAASATPVTFKTDFAGVVTEYDNVLIGDVYITSGQSNMELTLKSTEQTGTVEANSLLRYRTRSSKVWNEFTAENVESVSAISVLFAQELASTLDNNIPVGIISASVGASRVEDWIHSDYCFCEEYEFDTLAHSDYTYYDQGHHDLYKKYIQPIEKMTTAGVLWYQGESNRGIGEAYRYLDMFEILVDCWRTRMDDETLPFYTVQIMLYTGDTGKDRNGAAVDEYNIRIAQGEAARTMDGVTVCTMLSLEDTLAANGTLDIHPTDKLPIAKALANAALATYYYPLGDCDKIPEYSGPLYNEITVSGGTATVTFNHVAEGLMLTSGDTVAELEVRDALGNWVAATGTLSGNSVTVSAEGVDTVTGVRMGYHNKPTVNLYNTINGAYGYCASPFVWTAE